ncbi:MAG TPA: sulfur carrier protein ThiS [Pyrinomonadaceae bacterium]|nr:sulfur carrier protein ThiS [Pyrinomonadaceae bacterium]
MHIQVNGEPRDVADETTLVQLVSLLKLKPEQIAIELNRSVVRRAQWPSTVLTAGDTVEIVHFVGGGYLCADYTDYTGGSHTAKLRLLV